MSKLETKKVLLEAMSLKELRAIYMRGCEWHKVTPLAVLNSKRDYIDAINRLSQKKKGSKDRRMPRLGVGPYVKEILQQVVGKTADNFPIGLTYNEILDLAQTKFPESRVNARHVRWYASKLREQGIQPPVHRGMSKWQDRKEDM